MKKIILIFPLMLNAAVIYSQSVQNFNLRQGLRFEENRGLIADANGNVQNDNLFILIASDAYQNNYGGGSKDAFLVRFDLACNRIPGSYFGGTNNDIGEQITVDGSGNIYSAGYTSSTTGLSLTGNQNAYGGGAYDGYLAKSNLNSGYPTSQPTNLTFSSITGSSFDAGFSAAVPASDGYLVLRRTGAPPTSVPADRTTYTAGQTIGDGSVVFVGTGTAFQQTSLSATTTYYYAIFSYNGSGNTIYYLTTSPLSGNQYTLAAEPACQPTGISFTDISQAGMTLNFTAAVCLTDGYLIIRTNVSGSISPPVDGITYSVGQSIIEDTVVYIGPAISLNQSSLSSNTIYKYHIFSYNGSGIYINYLTSDPLESCQITLTDAPTINHTNISQQSFDLNWNAVAGATDYALDVSSNCSFLTGFENKSLGNIQSVTISGLAEGTKYACKVRAINAGGPSADSNTDSVLTIPATTAITSGLPTQTGFTLTWLRCAGADHYELELSQDNFLSLMAGYNPKVVADTSIELTGLASGGIYQARLKSANTSGKSPGSPPLEQQVIGATPHALNATNITSSSFLTRWERVTGITGYELDISTDDFASFINGYNARLIVDAVEENVTNLTDGTTYKYRVRSVNNSGKSPDSNIISVVPQGGSSTEPLTILNLYYENFFPDGSPGDSITFKITGGVKPYTVVFNYKGILADAYLTLASAVESDGSVAVPFGESMMDKMGMMFYIHVEDGAGTTISDNEKYIFYSFSAEMSPLIPINNYGGKLEDYQIISIPYILDDNLISSIFEPALGNYNKSKWRLGYYLNSGRGSGSYVDYGAGINRIEIGKGYWFNSREQVDISTGSGRANTQMPFMMALKQGWNEIADPYNVPVSWNQVLTDNGNPAVVGKYKVYDASGISFSDGDVMTPFSGGFVWADNSINISVTPATAKTGMRTITQSRDGEIREGGWSVRIVLVKDNQRTDLGSFGMHPEATEQKDRFDEMAVPRFIKYTDFCTIHPEYFYPWFSTDIVPVADNRSWSFNLESNLVSGPVNLLWDSANLNPEDQFYLFDKSNGLLVAMKETGTYGFDFSGTHVFEFYYVKGNRESILPESLVLGNAYPNPAKNNVTIPVSLPKFRGQYTINLSVYDLQGKKVKTLAQGNYDPGFYNFIWGGENDNTKKGPGLYLYRLDIMDSRFKPVQKKLIILQ